MIIGTLFTLGRGEERLKENNSATRTKGKKTKTAAMATVAEGIDFFHSYAFSFLIHYVVAVKNRTLICLNMALRQLCINQTSWKAPPSLWCFHLVAHPGVMRPKSVNVPLKINFGMQIKLTSASPLNGKICFLLPPTCLLLRPQSTVNKSNGMRDSIKNELPTHNMWSVARFKRGGAAQSHRRYGMHHRQKLQGGQWVWTPPPFLENHSYIDNIVVSSN